MAKVSFSLPQKFLDKISTLESRTDEVLSAAVEAGAEVILKKTKSNLSAVIGTAGVHKGSQLRDKQGRFMSAKASGSGKYSGRSTGELLNSLGMSPWDVDSEGQINVHIGFNEPRLHQYTQNKNRKGRPKTRSKSGNRSYYKITNAMIANVMEYGRATEYGRHGRPPRPFLKPAITESKSEAKEAMKKKLSGEIDKM